MTVARFPSRTRTRRASTAGTQLGLVALLILGCAGVGRGGVASGASPTAAGSQPAEQSLSVGGAKRQYWVYVPKSYSKDRPAPLLIAFHGGGGNPERFWESSQLNQTAEEVGFIAVYPAGSGRLGRVLTWNAGACCAYAREHNVDDIGFTGAILSAVRRDFSIDPQRIYVTGLSNGGMMAQRVACEMADRIAAVATVAGPLVAAGCSPARSVSVLEIHGTADQNVPYNGGVGSQALTRTSYPSIRQVMSDWARRDGCQRTSPAKSAKGGLAWETWGPCRDGSDVVLGTREGGRHEWLAAENRLIWEFVSQYRTPPP